MTEAKATSRLYATVIAVLVLFVAWAAVTAAPFPGARHDPQPVAAARMAALDRREQALRERAALVNGVVARRWRTYEVRKARRLREIRAARARYRTQLAAARASAAAAASYGGGSYASAATASAAPQVRVVSLPPVTSTRTS